MKYFLHRIQKENGTYSKGIEVHTSLDDAIRSFWGRMKTAYNNPQNPSMTFVSCFISDETGGINPDYQGTWLKKGSEEANEFFLHSIRVDGETVTKEIDVCSTEDDAKRALAVAMEYGYSNPKFPNVSFVSCEITDLLSGGMIIEKDRWNKPESAPEE